MKSIVTIEFLQIKEFASFALFEKNLKGNIITIAIHLFFPCEETEPYKKTKRERVRQDPSQGLWSTHRD